MSRSIVVAAGVALDAGGNEVENAADPTSAQSLVTKGYGDANYGGGGGGGSFSGASVVRTAAQAISDSTLTTLAFDAEDWDTGSYHDNSTNNTRLTVASAGYYDLRAWVPWGADNSVTRRLAFIQKNGSEIVERSEITAGGSGSGEINQTLAMVDHASSSDYYELIVFQNSGGSLNVQRVSGTDLRPKFQIVKLG